jgi:hypothetical protein
MLVEKYKFLENSSNNIYSFKSVGEKGEITKIVQFEQINNTNFYNLAFGDLDEKTMTPNDLIKSNNGDREKVLATVAFIVLRFLDKNPNVIIYAKGSTFSRTRLYQMGVSKYYHQMNEKYVIFGVKNDEVLPSEEGINYESFLVSLK